MCNIEILGHIFSDMCRIMGPNFSKPKLHNSHSKLGLVTHPQAVGCCLVSCCIVLKVCSAVPDESANELYNCNNLCSFGKHSLWHLRGFHPYYLLYCMATPLL